MSTGYTKCPHDLLRNPNLTPVEKIVWLFIASNDEDYIYTTSSACAALRIDPKTWRKTISALIAKGLATSEKRGNKVYYTSIAPTSSDNKSREKFPINEGKFPHKVGKNSPQSREKFPTIKDQIKEQENNFINKIKSACACEGNHDSPKSETHPNGEKETKLGRAREALPIDALKTELLGSAIWIESIAKGFNLSQQEVQEYIAEFCEYLIQCGEECKPLQEAKKHFRNRLNILINGNNKQTKDAGDDRRLGVARLIARYTG